LQAYVTDLYSFSYRWQVYSWTITSQRRWSHFMGSCSKKDILASTCSCRNSTTGEFHLA